MTTVDIKKEILDILEVIAPDEDLTNLDDAVNFRDQLELDSMDFLDIVMELRKRHRIQIPEDDYLQLASMNSTVKFLEPLMKDIVKALGKRQKAEGGRGRILSKPIPPSAFRLPPLCMTPSSSALACRAWLLAFGWPTSISVCAFWKSTRRSAG